MARAEMRLLPFLPASPQTKASRPEAFGREAYTNHQSPFNRKR